MTLENRFKGVFEERKEKQRQKTAEETIESRKEKDAKAHEKLQSILYTFDTAIEELKKNKG